MYNRVTTHSDAAFASCAKLPIYQKTLNVEEMADIDGLGRVMDALDAAGDYISDVADKVGDYISSSFDAAFEAVGTAMFGRDAKLQYRPDPFAVPVPPKRKLKIITHEVHVCDGPYVYSSYSSCLCPSQVPWPSRPSF